MKTTFLLAGLCLLGPSWAFADQENCRNDDCPTSVRFLSVSDTRNYGLLIAAPETGCRHVRFRVENAAETFLGHTPPLAPGELAVVPMGRGFSAGEHFLTVASLGCKTHPAATRRVTLAKHAPDHGWRAAAD
jgi:hypothetical protein